MADRLPVFGSLSPNQIVLAALAGQKLNAPMSQKLIQAFLSGMLGRQ